MASRSMRLLLLLSCLAKTGVLGDIIMRPSCAPGWFYHKSNCYGYFRKLRNWSDAEVRNLLPACPGLSRAKDQPEPQISFDSGSSVLPGHYEEKPLWLVKWTEEGCVFNSFNSVSIAEAGAVCQTLDGLQAHTDT
ncbi:REG4 isoform 4 [Pan troglodytes]|uniref:REG4 isoform 4 n=1 Tax=Pan troglodytes TaxID=9598 RepID=A0A2J8JUM8_PANTR|nr:regenerating islet-derived protein 4 isoform X2 [Pan paniscus]PNI26468.1 REG4 isoform 4 [Pan troglodytes]